MRRKNLKYVPAVLLTLLMMGTVPLIAQTESASEPRAVSYCELSKDPVLITTN